MMMKRIAAALALSAWLCPVHASDPVELEYEVSLTANASTGAHAPYMIGSWNYGRITGASGIWNDGRIEKRTDLRKRFSWGAGAEYMAGYGSAAEYDRYDAASLTMGRHGVRQAPIRLQQLYGEVKYRGVYLLAGMKERHSLIVDGNLSSGDLTRSNNSRPIPGVAAGFVDFQDIPLTDGWVQI
nr:capsule assembly Wzi family protein [Muribaculaceae bacterium]